jgi:putative membrane protein
MQTADHHPDPSIAEVDIFAIERPDRNLLTYYLLAALLTGPAFPFVALPLYFRYHTMRYRFTDEGVSMRWGVLFRREINLTYARIQDIHLTSNVVERWLGLARIQIQTASGSAAAEMTIEGVPQYEALRDFLYLRMRGARGLEQPQRSRPSDERPIGDGVVTDEIVAALRETAAELRAIRELAAERSKRPADG